VGAKSARDLDIAALAGRQHGVAARAQLVEAGLTAREIERRMLACGVGAVLSHQTAPAVWELLPPQVRVRP
jgi:hypothetical protein